MKNNINIKYPHCIMCEGWRSAAHWGMVGGWGSSTWRRALWCQHCQSSLQTHDSIGDAAAKNQGFLLALF